MPGQPKQPVLVLLTSHWVIMAGVALVTLAGISGFARCRKTFAGPPSRNPYIVIS